MSLRRSLLLTVFVASFGLTACEYLGLDQGDNNASAPAPVASVAAQPTAPTPAPSDSTNDNNSWLSSAPAPAASPTPAAKEATQSQTIVGRQIAQLRSDLTNLQSDVKGYGTTLSDMHNKNESLAANYYGIVGDINAKLQAGTTPGNPRLVQRWQDASAALDQFAASGNDMNALSSRIAASASMANYLLDATRATYSLSGAVDEDHTALKNLEDDVQRTVIGIGRALNDLTRDIDRQNAYIAAERRNLQTLSLAIARGEVYGNSLANVAPFQFAPTPLSGLSGFGAAAPATPVASENLRAAAAAPRPGTLGQLPVAAPAAPAAKTPFVIIRFDRPDVDYGQPLYQAMSQALEKNPMGNFEVVAVSPAGSGAKQSLAAVNIRGKAEDVMRTMAEMGVPADRMQLTTATSADAANPEVHLFLK